MLDITNQTREVRRQFPGTSLRSAVKHPESVFVFCTSLALDPALAARFESDACVEIANVEMFIARLKTKLRQNPRVKLNTFRNAAVTYYQTAEPPGATYALPDEIIMHKRRQFFEDEAEYRFAFSLKADTFDFENASYQLATGPSSRIPKGGYPQMIFRLGRMADCCRIHTF